MFKVNFCFRSNSQLLFIVFYFSWNAAPRVGFSHRRRVQSDKQVSNKKKTEKPKIKKKYTPCRFRVTKSDFIWGHIKKSAQISFVCFNLHGESIKWSIVFMSLDFTDIDPLLPVLLRLISNLGTRLIILSHTHNDP